MKTKLLLFVSALLMAFNLQAQAPEKFNYQGVARDNTGAPLANQNLGVKISILHNSTVDYSETHTVTTNDFGLYTLIIGDGTPVFGGMASVDWSSGNKFIKVEIDPNGGTNYTDVGTTELLSVPYALYAASAPGGSGGAPTGPAGGDLEGNYPNPSIANNAVTSQKIDNGTIIHADIAASAITTGKIANGAVTGQKLNDMGAASGEVLKWNGTTWAPSTDVAGTGGGSYTAGSGIAISGNVISADLGTDINNAELVNGAVTAGKLANDAVTAPKIDDMGATTGQVLKFDGTDWAPAADNSGSGALWTQTGSNISYPSGNVGIGTTTPDVKLHVIGTSEIARFEGGWVEFYSGGNDVGYLGHYSGNPGDIDFGTVGGNTGSLNLVTDLIPRLTIDKDGNVGIGTTIPGAPLEVLGDPDASVSALFRLKPTSLAISDDIIEMEIPSSITTTGYQFIEATVGTQNVFVVQDDGTVETDGGIEVTKNSTTANAHITLTENGNDYARINFDNTNTGFWALAGQAGTTGANSEFNLYYNDGTSGSNVLSASGDGLVGIGTVSPLSDLHINQSGGSASNQQTGGINLENGNYHWRIYNSNDFIRFNYSDDDGSTYTPKAYINASGAFTQVSDASMKTDIKKLPTILPSVMKLKPYEYHYIQTEGLNKSIGFLAQDIQKLFPNYAIVTHEKGESLLGVNYAAFGTIAIKAIQEQQKTIKTLQATIANMQKRLAALEQK